MKFRIRSQHLKADSSLRQTIVLRLRCALSRLSDRIRSVDVQLADVNGPRGGVDKRCRIAVRMEPRGTIVVEHEDVDLLAAAAGASERAARALVRATERRREQCRSACRSEAQNLVAIDDTGR
jgi:putative sigma-54 modulation protein